jgi:hypothetical protein
MANTGLQNLPEDYLYDKLPEGIITLDERGLLRAVIGGIQDRLEDIRSFAKKYEFFFDAAGLQAHNTVVLITFQTAYGKVVTRSLEIQDDTPPIVGTDLTAWAADEMGVDVSQISSCVFGEDLLRFVDENTVQHLAATVGAVLWSTSSQNGPPAQNQQRLLDSYFPRLKIKGTAQSFDTLGKLIGFEDVRMTPLWGRVSPRIPNDFGAPANDRDFSEVPAYSPQQVINSSYDPHIFRDGPYYSWTGTASADPNSSDFYTQSVNGFQPWVQFNVTGSTVVHPGPGSAVVLAGGAPHTKASALAGQGLQIVALAEGQDFNGLQVTFEDFNSGTDRLVSITDRLSAIKYRTSYYDLAHTMTDDRAIALFGTNTARPNKDLQGNPLLVSDGTAASPFRPWAGGAFNSNVVNQDFVYISSGSTSVLTPRSEATIQQSQFDTDALQQAGQQALQVMDEVRAATRQPRRSSVGYLDRDTLQYAAIDQIHTLIFPFGTEAWEGNLANPGTTYFVTAFVQGTAGPLDAAFDPAFSGTLVRFNDGGGFLGNFNLSTGHWRFEVPVGFGPGYLSARKVDLYITPTTTETIRKNPNPGLFTSGQVYQPRPEDQARTDTPFEIADEYPYRRDTIGGGELVEVTGHAVPMVPDVAVDKVAQTIAVKDQTGAEHTVFGVKSTVQPIRLVAQTNPTDSTYQPGQLAIAYKGSFKSLPNQTLPLVDVVPSYFTDLGLYMNSGFALYHAGLVQGVLVADPVKFFADHHQDGLQAWFPFSEHPDEGAIVNDRSTIASVQALNGFTLQDSFSSRKFDSRRGWYLRMANGASVTSSTFRDITDAYSASLWIIADGTFAGAGTSTVFSHGPLSMDLVEGANTAYVYAENQTGTRQLAATVAVTPGTFQQFAFTLQGPYVGYGVATLDSSLVLSTGTLDSPFLSFTSFGTTSPLVFASGTNRGYGLSDFRAWNEIKSQTELDLVRYHQPTATVCTYWPTSVEVAGNRDRYGLKVLDSGYVYPDKMPPAVRYNRLARVRRYNDEGRFKGENRYNETGFGGGMPLPPTYVLGQQFFELTSTGTTVFSTTTGEVPGYNTVWNRYSPLTGQYQFFSFSGSTPNGFTGTNQTVVGADWPPVMVFTNPIEQVIWLQTDTGTGVFEVSLVSSGTASAFLSGTNVGRLRSDLELKLVGNGTINEALRIAEQPTGARTLISASGTQVVSDVTGFVYQRATSGTLTTPPVYMYLNQRTKDDVPNAWTRWTDRVDPHLFGNLQIPPAAALNTNNVLEFENTSTLETGRYRLTIVSGNIGQVDADFEGFLTTITIDTAQIQARLAASFRGANFKATDVFEFELDTPVNPNWLLTAQWFNQSSDPSRGTARQMAIFGYKLEKIQTELYNVSIGPGVLPQVTQVSVASYDPTLPGGWLAVVNSYGTVVSVVHESLIYPSNDTVTSKVPMSSVLTSNTWAKREDHFVTSGTNVVIADATHAPLPSFSGIIVR